MADLVVRPSTKMVKFGYIVSALLALAAAAYALASGNPGIYLLLGIPFLIAGVSAKQHLAHRFKTLLVEEGKLRYQEGMLSRSTRTLELGKIQDVRVEQSVAQRLMGLGDLTLETAGETGRLSMTGIDQPQRVADTILALARRG
ncbi:MAG: PH domain-containing protein [Acidimicrobiia bacterium]|nr:PH domain-containing protein [Acidimicrobiia bacterium]